MDLRVGVTEYRKFGISVGSVLILLFGLALPWLFGKAIHRWPFYVGGPLLVLGSLLPIALKPVYIVWMKLAEFLGWINTRIILAIFYFLILTPLGILLKVLGKDLLNLNSDPKAETYWRVASDFNSNFDRPF